MLRMFKRSGWAWDNARTGDLYFAFYLVSCSLARPSLLDDGVVDAESVAEVEGVVAFAEDDAAVGDET